MLCDEIMPEFAVSTLASSFWSHSPNTECLYSPCELEPKATQVWAAHEEQAGQEVGGLMP
jgi:hypothetical protein